ncbi:hypothetical protein TNIN_429651 [Trichonephila inaurata madagascariensis]|uniref:Uncharacterized protein n=1 Tax=Trichonephila inaurata madagascariensis TaxID=2747483 RepID=A0A8X6YY47_9ARAC|nr:hypothetical protein TNIN_429651 [Trichonephila inaurata madagascariensis]
MLTSRSLKRSRRDRSVLWMSARETVRPLLLQATFKRGHWGCSVNRLSPDWLQLSLRAGAYFTHMREIYGTTCVEYDLHDISDDQHDHYDISDDKHNHYDISDDQHDHYDISDDQHNQYGSLSVIYQR